MRFPREVVIPLFAVVVAHFYQSAQWILETKIRRMFPRNKAAGAWKLIVISTFIVHVFSDELVYMGSVFYLLLLLWQRTHIQFCDSSTGNLEQNTSSDYGNDVSALNV
jgi:hypothetical protein